MTVWFGPDIISQLQVETVEAKTGTAKVGL
jgi:hypothetical protein